MEEGSATRILVVILTLVQLFFFFCQAGVMVYMCSVSLCAAAVHLNLRCHM